MSSAVSSGDLRVGLPVAAPAGELPRACAEGGAVVRGDLDGAPSSGR
ncbi:MULTISPECIES: hypothetical protein [unclassified Streptomyces]|nr:hypothetical protein OG457_13370 [Streptomyces sp. NBC_01207]WTA18056.1 hypothetical protein OG365_08270 [Streptomyces sp. NBC_00853]